MQVLPHSLIEDLFKIKSPYDFETAALKVFFFQADNNPIYKKYLAALGTDSGSVKRVSEIPYLPVEFFKTHPVKSFTDEPEIVFTSSGTTGAETSRHPVKDLKIYERSFTQSFRLFYGDPSRYCILALLPSYMEREGSSLIYMTKKLTELSQHNHSGFYLYNLHELSDLLVSLEKEKQKER
jgi:phenylacetate-coenzyme A ligase PaaK-like adenylate-forming protein